MSRGLSRDQSTRFGRQLSVSAGVLAWKVKTCFFSKLCVGSFAIRLKGSYTPHSNDTFTKCALLDWINTPTEVRKTSPAQRLFGKRTKTLLPTSNQLLKPKVPEDVQQKLRLQKAKQSINYNKGAKELEELRPGDIVRLQPTKKVGKSKAWMQARVDGKVDIRSYQVSTEAGRVYRRNRRHLRRTHEVMEPSEETVLPPPGPLLPVSEKLSNTTPPHLPAPTKEGQQHATPANNIAVTPSQQMPVPPAKAKSQDIKSPLVTTRSGRVVKPPVRFQ